MQPALLIFTFEKSDSSFDHRRHHAIFLQCSSGKSFLKPGKIIVRAQTEHGDLLSTPTLGPGLAYGRG
jgi:hypothetical protein